MSLATLFTLFRMHMACKTDEVCTKLARSRSSGKYIINIWPPCHLSESSALCSMKRVMWSVTSQALCPPSLLPRRLAVDKWETIVMELRRCHFSSEIYMFQDIRFKFQVFIQFYPAARPIERCRTKHHDLKQYRVQVKSGASPKYKHTVPAIDEACLNLYTWLQRSQAWCDGNNRVTISL